MSDLDVALKEVESARRAVDLFDAYSDDKATKEYRRLARLLHPDRNPDNIDRCQAAFARVSELWATRKSADDAKADLPTGSGFVISSKKRTFLVEPKPSFMGSIANIYQVTYNEDDEQRFATMKMTRNPRNSDLIQKEAVALRTLAVKGDEAYRNYVPRHIESFRHRDKTDNKERMANILDIPQAMYSLAEVYNHYATRGGLHPKDFAWIFRRLLVALGFIETAGLVHAGITLENVLIQPEQHGLVVIDWIYSTDIGEKVEVIDPKRRLSAPMEILQKAPVDPSTDIYMASRMMCSFLYRHSPRQFRSFIQGSMAENIKNRPKNAWALQEEFDDLLDKLWGARQFHPFSMPERLSRFARV